MKKILFAFLTVFTVACNEGGFNLEPNEPSLQNEVSTVYVNGYQINKSRTRANAEDQPALRFKDYNALEKFKAELNEIPDSAKIAVINKYGITSLHNIALIADSELEDIGNSANSEPEFRKLYKQYKSKYERWLIPNEIDTTDLTLYVPDEDNLMSYIANSNMVYVVGDKVLTVSLDKSLSESMTRLSKASVNSSATPTNTSVFSPKKGKKIYFDAYMTNIRMKVKMHCTKKMWYGWKNDPHRSYYFDSYLSQNFVYLGIGQYGQEAIAPRLPRYVFNKNVSNGFDIILGKTNGGVISGEIYTWTDRTSEHDANGNDITETIQGIVVPKCLKSKAHIIKINLKPQN